MIRNEIEKARTAISSILNGSDQVDYHCAQLTAFVNRVEKDAIHTIPAGYEITRHAMGYSYDALIKAGWTFDTLRDHGLIHCFTIMPRVVSVKDVRKGDIICNNKGGGVVLSLDSMMFRLAPSLGAPDVHVCCRDFIGGLLARDNQIYKVTA